MLINGEPARTISLNDRGFLYGDGVFETIRVIDHQLSLWSLHQQRLLKSCHLLSLAVNLPKLMEELNLLLEKSPSEGIVKIIVTRAAGGRGYAPDKNSKSTRIVQFHPFPPSYNQNNKNGVRVKFCDQPISINSRLAGMKHLGRLDQVLASIELSDDYDEGIMSTDSGLVIEGTKSNLFAVLNESLVTPELRLAGVAGVMREFLMAKFENSGTPAHQAELTLDDMFDASEIFLCNSVFGVWPVTELVYQEQSYTKKIGPLSSKALEFQDNEFSFHK